MVYTKVILVAGKVIDRVRADEEEFVDEDGYVEHPFKEFVHPYRCCSSLAGEKYIVGRVLHSFYRKSLPPCGKPVSDGDESKEEVEEDPRNGVFNVCGKYYACKKCLGTCTTGGKIYWFDVSHILDNVVEQDSSSICPRCYDIECSKGDSCATCGYEKHREETTAPVYDIMDFYFEKGEKPKFYLMLDDCLSCT